MQAGNVDLGTPRFQAVKILKVAGGVTPSTAKLGALYYPQALEEVHSRNLKASAAETHCVVNLELGNSAKLFVDKRNALKGIQSEKIV